MGEVGHPGPIDTQLDSTEWRGTSGSTVPANLFALHQERVDLELSNIASTGTGRLSLVSDSVPVVPSRFSEECHQLCQRPQIS